MARIYIWEGVLSDRDREYIIYIVRCAGDGERGAYIGSVGGVGRIWQKWKSEEVIVA